MADLLNITIDNKSMNIDAPAVINTAGKVSLTPV